MNATAAAILGETHPLDTMVRSLTGFQSVLDMMVDALASGDDGYRPTCRTDLDPRYGEIADVYDASAARLGLTKRSFRSSVPERAAMSAADCLAELEQRLSRVQWTLREQLELTLMLIRLRDALGLPARPVLALAGRMGPRAVRSAS